MKYTVSLIGRGLILGGGFGASIGQLLGQHTENPWELTGQMAMIGIIVSLASVLGIHSVRPTSDEQRAMSGSKLEHHENELLQRKRAA